MPYEIEIERRAAKGLRKLPSAEQSRIIKAIDDLGAVPRPTGCRPVQNAPRGTYRIRVGDYRVVYVVRDKDRLIIVARIASCSEKTYKRL